jgi:rSAM/selenodomain-associated transferase 2
MLSIIIPVFNEEATIEGLLHHLKKVAFDATGLEVIVVDGGSRDNTVVKVNAFASIKDGFKVITATTAKGRGKQMHYGATIANGEILYFLHADSYPPKHYDQLILNAVGQQHLAGCFRMKFKSRHPWLMLVGGLTRFSWKVSRGGDQSQYITRELYDDIGGYNTQIPIYEDYVLITSLYNRGHYHVIPKWLKTSARRYHEKGVMRLQWFYLTIYWKKYRGASMEELYQYYLSKCD